MRHEITIGGKHRVGFEDGVFVVVYDGEVEEDQARALLRASLEWSTGTHAIWCSNITNLTGYSAGARKVLSTSDPGSAVTEATTHLFVAGATIKSKAILALVMTASRLLGNIRFETRYYDTHDEALSAAKATFIELERKGLARMPDAAKR